MSGEARQRWDYEGRVVEALDKAEREIDRLTAALKDAEGERRLILEACEDWMMRIPCCERDDSQSLVEEIRAALQEPAPQGAEAGE